MSFSARELPGRLVKAVMVAVLFPAVLGLLLGVLAQLETIVLNTGETARHWVATGFLSYVGIHLLLYRPVPLFRVGHRLFSWLAVWLFGGQVASVESPEGKTNGAGKKSAKPSPAAPAPQPAEGSTLVAFSPYVIPLYTLLVCLAGALINHWSNRVPWEDPLAFCAGATIAFHWIMTADDLQQQRSRWHLETYLLAIGLVFLMTVVIVSACLPGAVPGFSPFEALSDGLARGKMLYSAMIQSVFL